MIKKMINQKIKTLTKKDIKDFAFKKKIPITDIEASFILSFIHNHPTLIYQDLTTILKVMKQQASEDLYQKAKPLVIEYYQKYKNYL